MSDSESLDYLQDGFNPSTLTMPRLRSILVAHNVHYPATAKKGQLIDLFNSGVLPKAEKILAERARARRSSKGIVDADTQSTASSDLFDQEMPPPRTTRASSPRKSTRVKRESEDPETMAPPPARTSPRKRTSRSTSLQPAAASDTDTGPELEAPRTARRSASRKLTPAPVKLEPPEEVREERDEDAFFNSQTPVNDSVFSSDNPFQSGGNTPATAAKTPSNRRKTTGLESVRIKTPSANRRRTDGPTYNANPDDVIPSVEFPLSKQRVVKAKTPEPEPVFIEAGEEFTAEEQLALDQEVQAHPELAVARQKPQPTRRGGLSTPIWALLSTLFVAYLAWYRQEKIAVGYCGLGRDAMIQVPTSIQLHEWPEWLPQWTSDFTSKIDFPQIDIEVPDFVINLLQPSCEPCPMHAYCAEDFMVRCEQDYVLKPHPLALGGLIPLPPTCEPDGEKARRVKLVADRAVEELRDRRAKYECGESATEDGPPVDSPEMDVEELRETVSRKRSKRMDAQEFDDLWSAAIGEIEAQPEVEVVAVADETGDPSALPRTRLSSTSLARLSYTCSIRRSVKLGLARYQFSLAGLASLAMLIAYARYRFQAYRALSAQVPALVDTVLERLSIQKELAFEDGNDDAFLFLPNLRDDVLRHIHSLAERNRVWGRVCALVEQNSNVRKGQRESRNGEIGRAWEWIGPARARIDDGTGEGSARRRRQSARVSWGPDVKGEDDERSRPPPPGMAEMAERKTATHRKWEESRPIY